MIDAAGIRLGSDRARLFAGPVMVWTGKNRATDEPIHIGLSGDDTTLPTQTTGGQAIGVFNDPGTVSGGRFDSSTDSACYLEAYTSLQPIETIGAVWRFSTLGGSTGSTGSGTLALVTWADGGIVAEGFGRRTSCHVTITSTLVQWYVRDVENGGAVTLLSSKNISPSLRSDVDHIAEVTIGNGTGTVTIDGTSYTWTDPRITPIDGERFACWEPYYGGAGKTRVQVSEMWADGTPYVPPDVPDTPTLIGSASNRTATSVTTLSATIPTDTQAGDQIIVAAGYLSSSAVLAGPGLTQSGAVARTGISTALYSMTAGPASAGSTVTVTSTVAAPAIVAVWVLRNVGALGTASTASQGSGSTTITVPARTATPGVVPLHVVLQASSTAAASSITTPATGMALLSDLGATSAQRAGAALMAAQDWSDTVTPGTTITQSGTQFVCAYAVGLTLS